MNRNLKCGLSALLVLVIVLTTVFSLPITAAEVPASTAEDSTNGFDESSMEVSLADEIFEDEEPLRTYADGEAEIVPEDPTNEGTEAPTEAPTAEPTDEPTGPVSVPAVSGIKRSGASANSITLKWNALSDVTGYNVYWKNADKSDSKLTLLSTVKSNTLTIRKLNAGAMYQIRVTAYKQVGSKKYEGSGSTVKAGTTPAKAKSFKATSSTKKYIEMKWSKGSNVDGYIIYRDYKKKWTEYKTLGKNATSFKDTKVTVGASYIYRIYPYRKDSTGVLKGGYSQFLIACGLDAPTNNGSNTRLSRVMLQWNKSPYAQGYDIYYSTDNKTFKGLASVKRLYYYTGRYKPGKKYYFRIYPYKMIGNTKVHGAYLGKAFTVSSKGYGKEPGDTYVEINIRQQHMWYIHKGKVYVSTDIVTGNRYSNDTPKGYWRVNNKARNVNLVGPGYVSFVRYWMAFIGSGYGIHDASWRSSFGGNIYQGNGSHGCVNTPYKNVKKMYEKMSVGTPVIIY